MISTPAVCQWAGPIIDVLLDYVGHVKLCSRLLEHLDSYPDWQVIKEKAGESLPTDFEQILASCMSSVQMYMQLGSDPAVTPASLCDILVVSLPVPPRSLMHLCRVYIRQQLGVNRLRLIHTLPLPGRLVTYMNHEERTQDFVLE